MTKAFLTRLSLASKIVMRKSTFLRANKNQAGTSWQTFFLKSLPKIKLHNLVATEIVSTIFFKTKDIQ